MFMSDAILLGNQDDGSLDIDTKVERLLQIELMSEA